MTDHAQDDDRLASLIKRVRPNRDTPKADTGSERWRPVKQRGGRRFRVTYDRDGAPRLRARP